MNLTISFFFLRAEGNDRSPPGHAIGVNIKYNVQTTRPADKIDRFHVRRSAINIIIVIS